MSTDVSTANKPTNQDKSEYGAPPARGVAALHQRDANTTTPTSTVTPHGGKEGRSSTPQTPCCTSEGPTPTPQCSLSSTSHALESMQARRIKNTRSMKAEKGWIKATYLATLYQAGSLSLLSCQKAHKSYPASV